MTEEKNTQNEAQKEPKELLSDKERVDKGQLLVRIVIEVLGAPKEHVEESVKLVIDRVNKIQNIDLLSEKTYEAEKKDNGLFSTFSELEIWFKNMEHFMQFMFDFTPSSVEIIQPENIVWKNRIFSGLVNDFLLKMHESGMKLSDTTAKLMLIQKNADAIVRNFVNFAIKKPRSAEELSAILGIPVENIKAILDTYIKAEIASENNGVYTKVDK